MSFILQGSQIKECKRKKNHTVTMWRITKECTELVNKLDGSNIEGN